MNLAEIKVGERLPEDNLSRKVTTAMPHLLGHMIYECIDYLLSVNLGAGAVLVMHRELRQPMHIPFQYREAEACLKVVK